MQLNHLNDHCMLAIFDKFSLQELFFLRIICSRWKHLIEQFRFRGQKSLKLFGKKQDIRAYLEQVLEESLQLDHRFVLHPVGHDDDLILNMGHYLDKPKCSTHFFTELFPNITTLVCYISDSHLYLTNLLFTWGSRRLSTLIVRSLQSTIRMNIFVGATLKTDADIPMPSLRSLYILDHHSYYGSLICCFPQLECLMLDPRYKRGFSLTRLDATRCTELRLNQTSVDEFVHDIFPLIGLKLRANLRRLVWHEGISNRSVEKCRIALQLVCRHFPALTMLKLILVKELPLPDIISELVHLPKLKELHLELRPYCSQWLNTKLVKTFTPLPTVRVFHLNFVHCPLFRLDRLSGSVEHLFPGLQQLNLNAGHYTELKLLIDENFDQSPFKVRTTLYKHPFVVDCSAFAGRHNLYR